MATPPFIVFNDADIDAAVEGAMTAKMRHSAETCTAANRFFVEEGVADEFTKKLSAAIGAVKCGPGSEDGVTCGPMINAKAIADMDGLVKEAIAAGATATVGGAPRRPCWASSTSQPCWTMLLHDSPITSQEIFGPIAPVIRFSDTDEMIEQANNTEMGLMAYVFTKDIGKGMAVSERLEAGMVGLNRGSVSDPAAPFGGMKQSGLGREGASEGIYEFCETQYIAAQW